MFKTAIFSLSSSLIRPLSCILLSSNCYIIVIHKEGLVDTEEIFPTICQFLLYVIQLSIKICSASILKENIHYSVAAFKVHNIF